MSVFKESVGYCDENKLFRKVLGQENQVGHFSHGSGKRQ
jgi:hypothetical protein